MIDAHTHLYSDKYRHDLDQVIQRAQNRLKAVVVSAVDIESLQRSLTIRQRYPKFIYVTAGIHPRKAAELGDEDRRRLWRTVGRFRQELVAVGEVGPDFHYVRKQRNQQRQLLVLEEALRRAEQWALPLVVHARKAETEALEVLSRSKTPVMFHCYAGSRQTAGRIAACGFYLSFSAILLFNRELQDIVTQIPVEQILIETDSPALSPRRGHKRNEPAYMEKIAARLATLLQYSPQKTAEITAANAIRFYNLPINL